MAAFVTRTALRRFFAFIALMLAVAWVPVSSHELLESAGWIHHDALNNLQDPSHEAADGICRPHDSGIVVKAPTLVASTDLIPAIVASLETVVAAPSARSYVRAETASPPGLVETWPFVLRLALPSRAPSRVS